jgi:hypothetical protein
VQSGDREIRAIRLERLCLEELEREKRPWVIEIRNGMKMGERDKSGRPDRMIRVGGIGEMDDEVVDNG